MSMMLSQLVDAAVEQLEQFGDMPVAIDREEDDYEVFAVEMRREIDMETKEYSFIIADYVYQATAALRLVK